MVMEVGGGFGGEVLSLHSMLSVGESLMVGSICIEHGGWMSSYSGLRSGTGKSNGYEPILRV